MTTNPQPTPSHEQQTRVPGDDPSVPRVINEPLDQHESSFVTGTAIFGIIVGGVIGGALGLIAAIFPVIDWWMGLIIGFFAGATFAAFVTTRLGLRSLADESLPPPVKRGGEPGARRVEGRR
jgi:hypothetical protein